jgi:hypothetical protein
MTCGEGISSPAVEELMDFTLEELDAVMALS